MFNIVLSLMNITLRSKVNMPLETVYKRFDADLFTYLLPPGAQLIAFGGSKKGDVVHLTLPLAGEWISEITEDGATADQHYFIDEGRKLPFPLKEWRHKHILHRDGAGTTIEDNMTYSAGNRLIDVLIYPFLFIAFLPRRWQYKRFFTNHLH
jgi:ligand-binding SRPBCC domain-containing protein